MGDLENTENRTEEEDLETPKDSAPDKKRKIGGIIREILVYALIFVFIVIIAPRYIWSKAVVDGESMENTLQDEDLLIQEKVSYYFREPERFDVVILKHHAIHNEQMDEAEDSYWVKRVIGLPGETIQIINGEVYINNQKLEEDHYGSGKIDIPGIAESPYTIPEGEYFVMGDNRIGLFSRDSRYEEIKSIKREDIIGRVCFRVYPFSKIGIIK